MLNPVKDLNENACQDKEETGKEPSDHLAVNRMVVPVATDLPVGINAQAAKDAGYGADDKHQI